MLVEGYTLTVVAQYPVTQLGDRGFFAVRGQGLKALSWNEGIKMVQSSSDPNKWAAQISFDYSEVGSDIQYKVLVDDKTWMVGLNAETAVTEAADFQVAVFPWFGSQGGTVTLLPSAVYSPQLNNSRQIVVYTPPSYTENPFKIYGDLLVAHDGNNLFSPPVCDTCCPFGCWDLQDPLDKLIVQGKIREVVVVGVFNTPARMDEYTYSKDPGYQSTPKANAYLDFIEETVVPLMVSNFRLLSKEGQDKSGAASLQLATLGSSLGGLVSCYAGYTRPQVYKKTACMSPSVWWNNQDFNTTILPASLPSSPPGLWYLDAGSTEETIGPDTVVVVKHLESLGKKLGKNLEYYSDPGGTHSEKSWGGRVHLPLSFMFGPDPAT